MTAGDDAISLSAGLAEKVRLNLRMTACAMDVIVPLEDLVLALGDALPLATLSVLIDRHSPDALIALGADGRIDAAPDGRIARLAA